MAVLQVTLILFALGGGLVTVAGAQNPLQRSRHRLPLEVFPDTLAVCRLPPDAALPAWASLPFLTVSRTAEELSITRYRLPYPPRFVASASIAPFG